MGDLNQFNWIKQHQDLIRGPVLEIGSRHYAAESAVNYRRLCDGLEFIGVDITEGTNVDQILDFTSDPELISEHLPQKFGTVICCSVLEHVENVFKMAENISHVVASSGTLFLSVPFTWRFHGYPSDYWRFTPKAVRYLFPDFQFQNDLSTISSNVPGDVRNLTDDPNFFVVKPAEELKSRYRLLGRFGFLNRLRVITSLDTYDYMLAPSCINMVGIKASV